MSHDDRQWRPQHHVARIIRSVMPGIAIAFVSPWGSTEEALACQIQIRQLPTLFAKVE